MVVPVEPGWLSLVPPLVAIALALATREVVLSLFAGVWMGALVLAEYNPLPATAGSLDYLVNALVDPDHIAIVVFSLLLGGLVGVMARSGGTQGIVEALQKLATTRTRGQALTWVSAGLHLLRRLREHPDPGERAAAHDGPAPHLPGEAGLHRGLHRRSPGRERGGHDLDRIPDHPGPGLHGEHRRPHRGPGAGQPAPGRRRQRLPRGPPLHPLPLLSHPGPLLRPDDHRDEAGLRAHVPGRAAGLFGWGAGSSRGHAGGRPHLGGRSSPRRTRPTAGTTPPSPSSPSSGWPWPRSGERGPPGSSPASAPS
jgi:hypothetical protein